VLHGLRDREASSRCQVDFASVATALAATTSKCQPLPHYAFASANASGQSYSSNNKPFLSRWWRPGCARCVRCAMKVWRCGADRTIVQRRLARKLLKGCVAMVVKRTVTAFWSARVEDESGASRCMDFAGGASCCGARQQEHGVTVGSLVR